MQSTGQTRFPRVVRTHEAHAPSQREYVGIALFLAVLTAIEVAIWYLDIPNGVLLAGLAILMCVKFATVAAFFMHLKYDGRLLVLIFTGGLVLAWLVFLVAITTIQAIH
jgi:caa(3)-type oxidase subunit IV